jgi:hypothetical protein
VLLSRLFDIGHGRLAGLFVVRAVRYQRFEALPGNFGNVFHGDLRGHRDSVINLSDFHQASPALRSNNSDSNIPAISELKHRD